jgi:hypothetical protein
MANALVTVFAFGDFRSGGGQAKFAGPTEG